jgi:uncharacterized protein with HEPN domain
MPSKSIRNILNDIRENIVFAQDFIAQLDFDAFIKSRRDIYAVTRAIEIISEASKRLPDEVRARHPQMPWRDIRDVGNFYRHEYDNVSASYVWRTVRDHLPSLLLVVQAEIDLLDADK